MNRWVNTTHLKKHTDTRTRDGILHKIYATSGTSHKICVLKYIVADKPAYAKKSLRHFKIEDAIKEFQNLYKDGDKYLESLLKVREDIKEYGMMIPDTSDEWEDKWTEPYQNSRTKDDEARIKQARISERNKSRKKFVEKFNKKFKEK